MSESHFELAELTDRSDIQEMEVAKLVGDALQQENPLNLWAVAWRGGAIVVKNLSISGQYGMILDNAERYSASAIKKDAVMKAGELLERAGMKRGKWDGEFAKVLEGADKKH